MAGLVDGHRLAGIAARDRPEVAQRSVLVDERQLCKTVVRKIDASHDAAGAVDVLGAPTQGARWKRNVHYPKLRRPEIRCILEVAIFVPTGHVTDAAESSGLGGENAEDRTRRRLDRRCLVLALGMALTGSDERD